MPEVATGTAEMVECPRLTFHVEDWLLIFEGGVPAFSLEYKEGFILAHFDLPAGDIEYHIIVRQPFRDICRTWVGNLDCWRGSELVSVAMNYAFSSSANINMPVVCNYSREGENRGVVTLLNQLPQTEISIRTHIEQPPMQYLQIQYSRRSKIGGMRETIVINKCNENYGAAIQKTMGFCRESSGINVLAAPEWAREPVWCSWYSHLYNLTQQDVESQIPYLKQLGIRTILIDASWFWVLKPPGLLGNSGDYQVEKNFFPDLLGLSRRVHAEGLKLMLWCAPWHVGSISNAHASLGDYCMKNGRIVSTALCPFCEESHHHVKNLLVRLMSDYELDGLKMDFMNISEKLHCDNEYHNHKDENFGQAMSKLMNTMKEAVLSVNPNSAIEYRISYSNLSTLAYANCHRGNDSPYDADYIRRENLFLRLFCHYPSSVWSDYAYWHPDESDENVSLLLGQQIFSGGVPTFSLNFPIVKKSHQKVISRWLQFYRKNGQAIAKAKLKIHSSDSVFSVSSFMNEDNSCAYVLIAGQHIPQSITLDSFVSRVWLLNASAEKKGFIRITNTTESVEIKINSRDLMEASI